MAQVVLAATPFWVLDVGSNIDDAIQLKGEHFTHVANDDFQSREAIEHAGGIQSKNVQSGLAVPSPAEGTQQLSNRFRVIACEESILGLFSRHGGM